MHPGIEKLENLFSDSKNHVSPPGVFFEELWLTGGTLPRPELHRVVERMHEYIQSEKPVKQKNLAEAKLAIGFVAFHEGNYESSLLHLAESQKLFSEIKDDDGYQAAAVMNGCDYRTMGELELALKCLYDAYEHLSKTGGYKIFQGFCIYNLAEIYSETGQYDEALRFHQLAAKHTRETFHKHMHARALNGIGVIYLHQKKYSMALDYLTQSLQLCDEIRNLPVKARTLTDIGSYYFEMGDYEAAVSCQEQALQIRNDLKIPNGAITNMVHLAEISAKQNRPDEAVAMLEKALRIAEEIKVKPKAFQIHLMLSEIYQSKNDLLKSLFHYKTYHHIREEVQHEDNEKKIKNLKLIFEAEQTKKENIIIKKQKEEIQKKNTELQETIDELTLARVSKKAKALTLVVAIVLFIIDDFILGFMLNMLSTKNYFLSLGVKMAIIFSLSPINKAIEKYLLKKVIKKRESHVHEAGIPST